MSNEESGCVVVCGNVIEELGNCHEISWHGMGVREHHDEHRVVMDTILVDEG